MAEFLIKRNDIVAVLNYNSRPGRHTHYVGVVLGILLPANQEVSEFTCITGQGDRNTKAKIQVQPMYTIGPNSSLWDAEMLTPIVGINSYYEDPHDVTIFTLTDYENMRVKFLNKLNVLSELLFGTEEFRIERIINKPKPFNINT